MPSCGGRLKPEHHRRRAPAGLGWEKYGPTRIPPAALGMTHRGHASAGPRSTSTGCAWWSDSCASSGDLRTGYGQRWGGVLVGRGANHVHLGFRWGSRRKAMGEADQLMLNWSMTYKFFYYYY